MDTVCYKKRVQDTIPCPTQIVSGSSSFFESNAQRPSPDFTSKSRSTIDAGQTCHRTSLSSSSEERLLQSTFSGSEEVGRMETSHRSLPTESACYHPSLQDGNAGLCSSFSTEKRLGHFPGFIRCVFSYSNTPEIQAISSFPFYGENVSIQSPSVRVGPSPICFFQSGKSSGQALPSYGHAPSFLPGRLAPAVSVPIFVSFSQRATSGHGFVPGICSKLDQIRACSQSEFLFSGSSFLSRGRTDRTFSRQDHETGNINSENVISSISFSQTDPFSFGTNGVYGSSIAGWQSPQTLASVAHQGSLVSSGPVMGFSHFLGSLVPTSGFSMAEQGFPVHHGASLSVPTRLVSIHGCESGWMGCSYGRLFSFRPMVSSLEGTAHQCSRTQGSGACPQMLCSHRSQLPCIAVNGQYYCSSLSEQRRGGPVANTIFHGDRSIRLVHEKTCVSLDQVCTRETECLSRLAFPERTDNSHRMDYSQGNLISDISSLGSSPHRLVRHRDEQSSADFHFSFSRSKGLGSGCHVSVLGRNDSVCISTHSTSYEGPSENGDRNVSGYPDSSMLGKSTVLSSSAVTASCSSSQNSNSEGSLDPTSVPPSASETGNLQPARLAVLQRGLEEAGFSKKSAKRVCAAKRSSTQSLYNSRWNTWMDWCLEREMDPIDPTIMAVSDFLTFLFEEKKLLPASIKGYRSAIASTLKHFSSVDFSSHPVLSDIIRSMELEKPTTSRIVPHWDLSLVLDCLRKSPYEPLSSCSLKCLTQKTVFLLALASGRRRSEIHALSATSGSVKFSADKSAVNLHFFPGFLAKNQLPSVAGLPLEIPALSGSVSETVLCPVRALSIYMQRTKPFRKGRKRLFVSYVKGYDKEISACTVSRWIVDTVRSSYDNSDSTSHKICAHELRALSSSFAWLNKVPLDSVLRAGYWRSENSFIKCYLRDTAGLNEKMFSLGPVVAAQKVIYSQ